MEAALPAPYARPWWLPNTHLETLWARRLGPVPGYRRTVAKTPDSDEVAIDTLDGQPGQPALVIFHGLEGCSGSHTVRQLAAHFNGLGWAVCAPNFRTCGMMNRLPRAYHAGDSADVGWMVHYARSAFPDAGPLHAVGVSLGGNALAKWLCEEPGQQDVAAAATVCAPLDLELCAQRFDTGFISMTYGRHFLRLLKRKITAKLSRYPKLATVAELAQTRTIREFDDRFTAPMHGFASAADYYARASAKPLLAGLATPLLCVQADNDALVPVQDLPYNTRLTVRNTRGGGHAGFVSPPFPGRAGWLGTHLEAYFTGEMA